MTPGGERQHSARQAFAQRLRDLRLHRGLTQEKLAARAGLHPNYIGSVERAERNISIDNIEKIARALAVPIPNLFSSQRTGR
jgi:transcriptional regulator with XRE-family HTH domain